MKAYITVGVSASGKSTWAKTKAAYEINRDTQRWLHMREQGIEPCWANWKWKWEKIITERCDALIETYAKLGQDIIISDTNLGADRRRSLMDKLNYYGYHDIETVVFPITFEEAIERDNAREHGVGYSVIAGQFEKFDLEFSERYQPPTDLPQPRQRALIIDVDGTLASMRGRKPYDWHKVYMDAPKELVIAAAYGICTQLNAVPIIVSGRDGVCYKDTRAWLTDFTKFLSNGLGGHLLMREANDTRKDTIVKREIFNAHIRDKYDVVGVIDDRPSVCRMWRSLGLEVIQIGNPYIEF